MTEYERQERCYFARVSVLMAVYLFVMIFGAGAFAADLPDPLVEHRYAGTPKRDAKGEIIRRADVRIAFQKIHPCPSTGLQTGACPGWQRDHIIPLASCGADAVSNMQWLPLEIKTCAGKTCKDRFERQIYTCAAGGTK